MCGVPLQAVGIQSAHTVPGFLPARQAPSQVKGVLSMHCAVSRNQVLGDSRYPALLVSLSVLFGCFPVVIWSMEESLGGQSTGV